MHLGPSTGQWLRPPGASRAGQRARVNVDGGGEWGVEGWGTKCS